ncbi:CAMK family protein kinase [Trichomonas vaginalis G3]|uniref:CAMK family protein kinase n=1 Tax=Trichomonas vaginalis (strain ATCC PRA-98 / G3) TaxID=412133 RepID=A2DPA3_TRIV3|nr:regulation of centriole replication [Trichomonas vaginalis G3]EAY17803.1 CAMK family protein kinase [Trichomonas vaginalis G3]KAI5484374.1 regulation of centriole replication [Trichomonas vaginalis G3]|eukprot:XP_001329938.1 CAMK family protein kinase [Trichomonas vaginalis G3]
MLNLRSLHKENYRIESEIGRGSFGAVFKAFDKVNRQYVCIKQVEIQNTSQARLNKEIDIHSSLNHPNIVKFYGTYTDESYTYIVMEYCPNGSLYDSEKYRNHQIFSLDEARSILNDLGKAIQYMHNKAFIHHDIKPGNMLFDKNNHIKLCDFGLSTSLKDVNPTKKDMCGTLHYIAPEVLKQRAVSRACDIWSFGVILYTLLVGRFPFEADSQYEMAQKSMSADYSIPSFVDPVAADLINQCLSIEPKTRPSIDKVLEHQFFNPQPEINFKNPALKKDLICPFSKGTVTAKSTGELILDLDGRDEILKILPDVSVLVVQRDGNILKHFEMQNLPKKYLTRVNFAIDIVKKAQAQVPILIWHHTQGKFVMHGDMSIKLLRNNMWYDVDDSLPIIKSMKDIVSIVKNSSDPQFPIIIGSAN